MAGEVWTLREERSSVTRRYRVQTPNGGANHVRLIWAPGVLADQETLYV